jgi:hypothetical protein
MVSVGLPSAVQHAAQTRDDGKPSLEIEELFGIGIPSAAEVGYACSKGWFADDQARAILAAKVAAGVTLSPAEQRLNSGETSVPQFAVEVAGEKKVPESSLKDYWLYVFMTWGWRVRREVDKASELLEAIWIALDRPYQLADFVWMGRRWGPKVGFMKSRKEVQLDHWKAYLDSDAEYFRDRAMFQRAVD